MIRTKRSRRGSTGERASEDTTSSASPGSLQPRSKRLKPEAEREPSSSDIQSPPSPNSSDLIEEIFTAVVTYHDEKANQVASEFIILPSRKQFPDYYDTIEKPIDLKQIALKIQKNVYRGLDDISNDLILMADNAIQYNMPKSPIHTAALMLKKFVVGKKAEYEERERARTAERTVRTRRSTAQVTQPYSAIYAALEYEADQEIPEEQLDETLSEMDTDEEASQESGSMVSSQDADASRVAAMEELYSSVYNMKGPLSRPVIKPFVSLPSKKTYPMYYTSITNPICMNDIKRKMKKGLYVCLDDMILDLQLMCQNAEEFNDPESAIHKDAGRINKFVEGRLQQFRAELDKCSLPLRTAFSERMQQELDDIPLRKRCKFISRSILEFKANGQYLIVPFLEKPSKREYPDYYDIIAQPIDVKTITQKVSGDKYYSDDDFMADIKLLFDNAKRFNEEGSDIYNSAVKLEEIAKRAFRIISTVAPDGSGPRRSVSGSRRSQSQRLSTSPLQASLYEIFEYVVNYVDDSRRVLSEQFMTLPTKQEMPDYYNYIKKPIDLVRIEGRIQHDQYLSIDDMIEDFGQCFENACSYNEPNSQIYKDAVVLCNAVMEKAKLLGNFNPDAPCVTTKVQEIIHNLMDHILNYEDATGRNLSETIAECTWSESDGGSEHATQSLSPARTAVSLDTVRLNVLHGRYRRVDRFQDDLFELLEKARFSAQPDSQTYEDAVELHLQFIHKRNELCANGTRLFTRALDFTASQFQSSIDQERRDAKLRLASRDISKETSQGPGESSSRRSTLANVSDERFITVGSESYFVGDFVYLEPYEKGKQPLIACIEDFVLEGNVTSIKACYILRPHETYHVATKTFLEKELFKSDLVETHLPGRIIGRCYIMEAKDYFKLKPLGFEFKDVYVCEARYNSKVKSFKKIKVSGFPPNNRVQLVKREKPLPVVRIPSIFASKEGSATKNEPKYELCRNCEIIDVFREDIVSAVQPTPDECLHYEQKESPIGYLKIGDGVLVRNSTANQVVKIDHIFSNKENRTFIKGTIFIFPQDMKIGHVPAKLFYKNEIFQTTNEVIHPVEELKNRCAILSLKDYSTCRQTEIPEEHVYITESKIQDNGTLFKRHKGQRMLNVNCSNFTRSTPDEIYFFEKSINCKRVVSPLLEAALSGKIVESDASAQPLSPTAISFEEELESATNASEASFMTPMSPAASNADGFTGSARKRGRGASKRAVKKVKYTVSGFILYGAEHRRSVKDTNPGLSFQDTSRFVSDNWKALPPSEKKKYDDEARRRSAFINEQLRSKGLRNFEGVTFKGLGCMSDMEVVEELERRVLEQENKRKAEQAAIQQPRTPTSPAKTVPSVQRGDGSHSQPSTSFQGQGVHGSGEPPKADPNVMNVQHALQIMQAQQGHLQRIIQQQQSQMRPLFMTLPSEPPKIKRALHSEVFLRYLENNGMNGNPQSKPAVPFWRKQLSATQTNTQAPNQVPDYWPSLMQIDMDSKARGMELVTKMWSTRNLMMAGLCNLVPLKPVHIQPEVHIPVPNMSVTNLKTSSARRAFSYRR